MAARSYLRFPLLSTGSTPSVPNHAARSAAALSNAALLVTWVLLVALAVVGSGRRRPTTGFDIGLADALDEAEASASAPRRERVA